MGRSAYDVMDLKALRCFLSVARHGSLTKAGIELGISEAAISQRVKALEGYLGVKLYETRGGRVRLTPAGEHTMSLAVSMFGQIGEFEKRVAQSEEMGELVLASIDEVLGHLLLDIAEKFSRAHPLARLRLMARPVEETLRLVKGNAADLGVVPARDLPKELVFHPIATYPAYLLTPKGHPLARQAMVDFKTLLNAETIGRYPLIVAEVQLEGYLIGETFAQHNLALNIAMEVGTFETLRHYVARGLGVAVVPGLCVTEGDRARLEMVPIPAELGGEATYGVVVRHDKHRGALLDDLLRLLGVGGQIH